MNLHPPITHCLIWGEDYEATGHAVTPYRYFMSSSKAGGDYQIDRPAQLAIKERDDIFRAKLTAWLDEQRAEGVKAPIVTEDVLYSL